MTLWIPVCLKRAISNTLNGLWQILKRQKQKLQDTLLELNVRSEIELSDDTVKVLTDNNILYRNPGLHFYVR